MYSMIPKIIHHIWFGEKSYPKIVKKCLKSLHKILPDYEIMYWNSDNFNLNINPWVRQAYDAKKYAFVSDFARLYLLYKYGGIYVDTDIEILKNLDQFLSDKAFIGVTSLENQINAGIIGSEASHPMIKILLDYYEDRNFIMENGEYDERINAYLIYELLLKEGMKQDYSEQIIKDVHLYPKGYFLLFEEVSLETRNFPDTAYALHYGTGSWSEKNIGFQKLLRKINLYYNSYAGDIYQFMKWCHLENFYMKSLNIYKKYIRIKI